MPTIQDNIKEAMMDFPQGARETDGVRSVATLTRALACRTTPARYLRTS